MLLEIQGICQHCAEEVRILVLNGDALDECHKCKQSPFTSKVFKGIIYVVSNPNQIGVKIGLTTKTMEQRLKSLNSTGVPGDFQPVAIFPSDSPVADERRVHEKLRRRNLAKEHFDLDPVDAVLAAYRALNKRRPIFFDQDIKETFDLRLEEARIQMQLRLKGAKA
jgi:predicted nucleic acid-binding protein